MIIRSEVEPLGAGAILDARASAECQRRRALGAARAVCLVGGLRERVVRILRARYLSVARAPIALLARHA